MFGDWLQGPVFYDMPVMVYGWDDPTKKRHFFREFEVIGFLSAVVVGPFIGSVADSIGRKHACRLYCVFNILTAIAYHFSNYYIIAAGRFCNGIATRILFTAFESWFIKEHIARGFSGEQMGATFGWM